MSAQNSRARKILLSLQTQNSTENETNNPDTALFLENQFPKPYDDDETQHCHLFPTASTNSQLENLDVFALPIPDNAHTHPENFDVFALPIPDNAHTNPENLDVFALHVYDNAYPHPENTHSPTHEYGSIDTVNGALTNGYLKNSLLFNTDTLHFVDNVVIEETNLESEDVRTTLNSSPSLLHQYTSNTIVSRTVNRDFYEIAQLENDSITPENIQQPRTPQTVTDDTVEENYSLAINPVNYVAENISLNHSLNEGLFVKKFVDYSDSDSEPDEPVIKRKKRCQVKKEEWVCEVNKKNREKGKKYVGKKKTNGEWDKNVSKPERTLKPRCACKEKSKGVIKCHEISEEDRRNLFNKFWHMTWEEKRVYVGNMVKLIHTNRQRDRKNPEESKRINTFIYYLKKGEETVRVCKTLFLNTLCIGKSCVWNWKTKGDKTSDDDEQATSSKTTQSVKKPFDKELAELQNFLNELPKLPSHYCRKRTAQSYLQPDIKTKRQLYDLYKNYCNDKNVKHLSIATFSNTLTVQKISVFKPKKDQCAICNKYELGKINKDEYEGHVSRKEAARAEKESDKKNKEFVFTADLQAVLLAPRSNVSSHYYKTKLCVHNWCIYDMKTGEGYCFLWNETDGGLNSDEFATIISKFFIESIIPKMGDNNREITLYSDGCTYRNRNTILTNALVNVAMLHNVTIIQKYLEVGHTQMEVDSMHAMIEKKLKNVTINVPAEYITICKKARNSQPYQVKYLNYGYFKNFQGLNFYKSIRPGKMKGDPKVTDIRCLKYDPSGRVFYKLRFSDEFTLLNQRRNNASQETPLENLPQMYQQRRKITKKKFSDLQELKHTMPDDYQNYYENLPHEA